MIDISCEIIEDLLPLVKDGVASQESIDLVKDHIEKCQFCRQEMVFLQTMTDGSSDLKDEEILKNIKRKLVFGQMTILVIGTIIGIALTYTMGVFYNIALMPLLGALSYISLKEKWYLTPLAIVGLSYLWQIGESIIAGYFSWSILYGALIMTGIYGGLTLLGVLIGLLLKFAWGREM